MVAITAEQAAEDLLGLAVLVALGGVDEGAAGLREAFEDLPRLGGLGADGPAGARSTIAAVEVSDDGGSGSHARGVGHKRAFAQRIADVAAEAGARDPEGLGRRLAVLVEGATSLSTSLNSPAPFDDARAAAEG